MHNSGYDDDAGLFQPRLVDVRWLGHASVAVDVADSVTGWGA